MNVHFIAQSVSEIAKNHFEFMSFRNEAIESLNVVRT